jgi:RNA polymerase sigma-70 factor (ECF subfamily)
MNTKDVEDQILVERSLQGEQQAFEQLVERYQKSVYNLAYRMTGRREDAESLTQETFLRAYAKLETFQADRRFSPWLFRIASNLCINWKNRQERRELSLDSFSEDKKEQLLFTDTSADPLFQVEQDQLQTLLQQEILALPIQYRLVFTLRYLEDHSCREIAEILDMPEGTVKTHLFRARRILKEKLKNFY